MMERTYLNWDIPQVFSYLSPGEFLLLFNSRLFFIDFVLFIACCLASVIFYLEKDDALIFPSCFRCGKRAINLLFFRKCSYCRNRSFDRSFVLTFLCLSSVLLIANAAWFKEWYFWYVSLIVLCGPFIILIDSRYMIIPDSASIIIAISGIIVSIRMHDGYIDFFRKSFLSSLVFFTIPYVTDLLYRTYKKTDKGIGFGDLKLMAAIGVSIYLVSLPDFMLLSASLAVLFNVKSIVLGHRTREIAFGPYIFAAFLFFIIEPAIKKILLSLYSVLLC